MVDPPEGTEIITELLVLKVAVTASAAVIATTHAPVPEHAPLHPANAEPVDAACVSVTCVPLAKFAEHALGQLIPAGELVTIPCPLPASATVSAKLPVPPPKFAITVVAAVIVKVQVLVPSHAVPPHPVNVDPDAGVAVKVT